MSIRQYSDILIGVNVEETRTIASRIKEIAETKTFRFLVSECGSEKDARAAMKRALGPPNHSEIICPEVGGKGQ
jgi:uncharacterized ferredoxin-like protein